jgi:CheY-like chemotaxis protein
MDQALPAKIMVIGDDTNFCYLMRRYIRESCCSLVPIHTVENILEVALQANPAAIILEINPHTTMGWLALRSLKSNPEVSHIPVILCSWQDDEPRGISEGADIYLRMPILYDDYLGALQRVGIQAGREV